jgi:hypothetical protein
MIKGKTQGKKLVNSLDDDKQWAPLHYAVYYNNIHVYDKLTKKDKGDYKCGM